MFIEIILHTDTHIYIYLRNELQIISPISCYPIEIVAHSNAENHRSLSPNPSKWSKTLKQFFGFCVFGHFVGLALQGLRWTSHL